MRAGKQANNQRKSQKIIKSFLNGGVVFSSTDALGQKHKREKSLLDDGGMSFGKISLNLEVPIERLSENYQGITEADKREAKVIISGTLSDLVMYNALDFDLVTTNPAVGIDLAIKGTFTIEAKLEGNAKFTVGDYSKAWKDVEKKSFDSWGIKMTGLSEDDKRGKFPILGLVFTSLTPAPINNQQIAVNTAKSGGVIPYAPT